MLTARTSNPSSCDIENWRLIFLALHWSQSHTLIKIGFFSFILKRLWRISWNSLILRKLHKLSSRRNLKNVIFIFDSFTIFSSKNHNLLNHYFSIELIVCFPSNYYFKIFINLCLNVWCTTNWYRMCEAEVIHYASNGTKFLQMSS